MKSSIVISALLYSGAAGVRVSRDWFDDDDAPRMDTSPQNSFMSERVETYNPASIDYGEVWSFSSNSPAAVGFIQTESCVNAGLDG